MYPPYIYTQQTQPQHTEPNQNAQSDGNSSTIKQLLEALLLTIKICTGYTTDVIWMNTIVNLTKLNS